jgi:hypothetical protein
MPMELVREVIESLEQLEDDTSIPKNIRKIILEARQILLNTNTPLDVRSATTNSRLEEIVNDPNIPLHARTLLWGVMSKLETIK